MGDRQKVSAFFFVSTNTFFGISAGTEGCSKTTSFIVGVRLVLTIFLRLCLFF